MRAAVAVVIAVAASGLSTSCRDACFVTVGLCSAGSQLACPFCHPSGLFGTNASGDVVRPFDARDLPLKGGAVPPPLKDAIAIDRNVHELLSARTSIAFTVAADDEARLALPCAPAALVDDGHIVIWPGARDTDPATYDPPQPGARAGTSGCRARVGDTDYSVVREELLDGDVRFFIDRDWDY